MHASFNSTITPMEYTSLEISVGIIAIFGNLLVIIVFTAERRLRRLTNLYILSLAVSDLLVGLVGIPSAILTRYGFPKNAFIPCLAMLGMLLVLCTVSILNLLAVSIDRYWAILHPLAYHRLMSGRAVAGIIVACWIMGAFIGSLPLMGWNNGPNGEECTFIPIMNYDFLVFIYFATIVYPALMMAFFYARIYLVVLKQLRQIAMIENQLSHSNNGSVTTLNQCGSRSDHRSVAGSLNSSIRTIPPISGNPNGGHHIHKQVRATSKREVKKAKTLFIIVLVFMVCWVPLYTVNCVQAFCKTCTLPQIVTDCFIVLSHANSAINPFLYAYHMREFRDALKKHIFRVKPKVRGRGVELNSLSGHLVKANGNINTSSQPQTVTTGSSKPRERAPRLSEVPEVPEAVSTSGDVRKNSDVFPVVKDAYFDCERLQYELVNKAFVRDDLDEGFESTNQNSPIGDLEVDSSTSRPIVDRDKYEENLYVDKVTKRYSHSHSLDEYSPSEAFANQNSSLGNRDGDWPISQPITNDQIKYHRRYMHSVSLDADSLVCRPNGKLPALKVTNRIVHSLSLDSHLSGMSPMISKPTNHVDSSISVEPIANLRNNGLGSSPNKPSLILSVEELWDNLSTNQKESTITHTDDSSLSPTVDITTNQVFSSNYVTNEESQRNDISV